MKEIELVNKRGIALIDDEDYEASLQHRWYFNQKLGYAFTLVPKVEGCSATLYLHQFVGRRMGFVEDLVDHKDRNRLDCTRTNLRPATRSQSNANRGTHKNNRLGVKGVTQVGRRFQAKTQLNKIPIRLGLFDTIEEASAAYIRATTRIFGEFACWA